MAPISAPTQMLPMLSHITLPVKCTSGCARTCGRLHAQLADIWHAVFAMFSCGTVRLQPFQAALNITLTKARGRNPVPPARGLRSVPRADYHIKHEAVGTQQDLHEHYSHLYAAPRPRVQAGAPAMQRPATAPESSS